jgi:uncharacterized protein GlcG (DUF336 family)
MNKIQKRSVILGGVLLSVASANAMASCNDAITAWQNVTTSPVGVAGNGGFGFPVWVAVVDEAGTVCGVINTAATGTTGTGTTGTGTGTGTTGTGTGTGTTGTGTGTGSTGTGTISSGSNIGNKSWLGGRIVAIQKATTANSFSIDTFAISSANLYGLTLPGGSMYGLQFSHPIDLILGSSGSITDTTGSGGTGSSSGTGGGSGTGGTGSSSGGTSGTGSSSTIISSENVSNYGQGTSDPATGTHVGGVSPFGGGLALYNSQGIKVGAIGVSGDTPCTDHAIAWRLRTAMALNNVPTGFVSGLGSSTSGVLGDELVINTSGNVADITNTYEHPSCAVNTITNPTAGEDTGVIVSSGTGTGTTGTGTSGTGTTGTGTSG